MATEAAVKTVTVPLRRDQDGVLRVGNTRVPLETVIHCFDEGATPEEIVQDFSSLGLADVYAVIGYYLQNRGAVEAYLRQAQQEADALRGTIEARFDPHGVRQRLLARRAHGGQG